MEMEKAQLKLRKSKKNKIIAELYFTDSDKTMPFPQFKASDTGLNKTEVKVQREKGKIIQVKTEEKVLYHASTLSQQPQTYSKSSKVSDKHGYRKQKLSSTQSIQFEEKLEIDHVKSIRSPAHAPYNFVPLNEKIVEIPREEIPTFNKYHENRHTGWIDIEVETLTPLYIRGTLSEQEVVSEMESKDKSDFFSPGNKIRIPGSSIRGMIRTLVEIASFGKFENFNDRHLYYRGLADMSNLRKEYQENMSSYDRKSRKSTYKVSAGILRKEGMDYKILSSEGNFEQILKNTARNKVESIKEKYQEFSFYKFNNGYLIVSGDMKNKRRDWWIDLPIPGQPVITLDEKDIENYKNDTTRSDRAPDLVKLSAKKDIPCFYVKWRDSLGNDRISFGHTGMFRLAYKMSIGDLISHKGYRLDIQVLKRLKEADMPGKTIDKLKALINKEFTLLKLSTILNSLEIKKDEINKIIVQASIIDIPEAIFGNEKTFVSRVFFEDAFLNGEQGDILMGEYYPKILSSPNPTTFQHYLVQSSDNKRQLNHYNSPATIRGNKLYWHKSGNNWKETDVEAINKHASQYTRINPVRPGVRFTGKIRFENFSDIELGALLFVLELPENCCHKLGMGKPLGLGSVQIQSDLRLSKRKKRYQDLYADWSPDKSDKKENFKQAFAHHILQKIGAKNIQSLWDIDRMRELAIIMNFEKGKQLENKNSYMNITPVNDFKTRPVLPLASCVK